MDDFLPAYAVVRIDLFAADATEKSAQVTVKRIMWDRLDAETEAARLNHVNAGKDCLYFAQYTRVDRPSSSG
jgi:hypothetical protein